MSQIPPLLPLLAGGLAALGCLAGAFWALWRKRLIDDLPTSKTQGVFIGLSELKGTAESDAPLRSYLAGARCVQYDWRVEEHWSRTVHETYRDAQGHTRTRTRVESGWTRIAGDREAAPFYLKDDTGVIRIVPDGATIHGATVFDQACGRGDPLYFGKGPVREISHSTHRRRFFESALPLHAALYVMGQARERQDLVAAEIARDDDAPMFLISTQPEKQVSRRYRLWFLLWVVLGALLASGGAGVAGAANPVAGTSPAAFVAGAGGFLLALGLGWVWTAYNSLVSLRQRVRQGWSQVDVQLKRRHDLIPNLLTVVEGYCGHESETQRLLAEMRAQAEAADAGSSGLAPLLAAVSEGYPGLKASQQFACFQQALVDAEQRIALARDYFKNIATFHNNRLAIIPDRFVARLVGLRPEPLMGAADFERAPVQVSLAS